jgi:hypothetical protein
MWEIIFYIIFVPIGCIAAFKWADGHCQNPGYEEYLENDKAKHPEDYE